MFILGSYNPERRVKLRKTILDDGSYPYLTEGAELVGAPGIPALLDIDNVQVPHSMIPFEKAKRTTNKRRNC